MSLIFSLLYLVLAVIQFVLVLRIVLDVVQSFARTWRPHGLVLVVASVVYTLSDPPLRWLRSKIPPVNLGGIGLDVAFLVLFVAIVVLKMVTASLAM